MFGVDLSEFMVIGVVALIVIGPEKLPRVARTAGLLLGRLQRHVAEVKADISREIQLDEMKRLQAEMLESARDLEQNIQSQVRDVEQSVRAPMQEVQREVEAQAREIEQGAHQAASEAPAAQAAAVAEPAVQGPGSGAPAIAALATAVVPAAAVPEIVAARPAADPAPPATNLFAQATPAGSEAAIERAEDAVDDFQPDLFANAPATRKS